VTLTKNNITVIVVAALIAVACWVRISSHYTDKLAETKTNHAQRTKFLRGYWVEERKGKLEEYHAQLEKACGGGIEAAVRDPDLPIADMLCKAAKEAYPGCSKTDVKTDNFTEFDVVIEVKSPPAKEEAAQAVRRLLSHCGKYVNSISLVCGKDTVKAIDRRGIDAIKDWSAAEVDAVAAQIYTP
jgi:hypothetical protein